MSSPRFVRIVLFVVGLSLAGSVAAQKMRAHFIDVGQGASTLLEFPCAAVLVDAGGEKNGDFESTEALMDYLDDFFERRTDLNNTLQSFILTHPHIDHTRGVKEVLGKYRVLNGVTNGLQFGSGKSGQNALHKKARNEEATGFGYKAIWLDEVRPGIGLTDEVIDPVACADVDPVITALWGAQADNPGWTKDEFTNVNNHSVVVRIDFGKASLLISGDLQETAIPGLIARYKQGKLLDVDVYQVGHHGSHDGTTQSLLKAMTPQMAVIAMGEPKRHAQWTAWDYGHPRADIVDLLQKGVSKSRPKTTALVASAVRKFKSVPITKAVYATGWDGTVVLEADVNGSWKVLDVEAARVGSLNVTPTAGARKLNLNTASADELATLPLIGPKRAADIVRYREEKGPFSDVEGLKQVEGIGAGTVSAVRPLVKTQ
jgi:competence ComEA-like helix-hairpin-helix protein